VYGDKRANQAGKLPDNTWILSPLDLDKCFTDGMDTWLASRICGTFGERHDRGTVGVRKGCPQMPLAIMDRVILTCSKPGDVVLDPFGGTFATGASAIQNGRQFIGFDIDKTYVVNGNKRLDKIWKATQC
jgi:hypothetical protein